MSYIIIIVDLLLDTVIRIVIRILILIMDRAHLGLLVKVLGCRRVLGRGNVRGNMLRENERGREDPARDMRSTRLK